MLMFIAALFIIAKKWKPPKSTLVDEWINNLWYTWGIPPVISNDGGTHLTGRPYKP